VELVRAWGRGRRVCGFKPIESGGDSDGLALAAASTFHVKQPAPYVLRDPVSPHRAARLAGRAIDPQVVRESVDALRSEADAVAIELAGGLFTPIGARRSNVDLVLAIAPTKVIVVAPDRLGVLHDVGACTRAAATTGLTIDGIVLDAPETPDPSTGTNAAELIEVTDIPILATIQRDESEGNFINIIHTLFGV
jgi:dethiobiotin synthetase